MAMEPGRSGRSWSRKIASGASKFLHAVFISDSSSDSDSEHYVSDHGDDDALLNHSNTEAQRKHAIKHLLLQETFSREECHMLVKIINSRVDSALIPGRKISVVTPEHAVMEAKKFIEEKKAGRSPQSEFGHGSIGSPADMAKSYMQSRPPWDSPSNGNLDSITHLRERSYPACGAWDMQDEIRRLRSKASEYMVSPLSSSKVDQSLLSPLPRSSHDNGVIVAIPGESVNLLGANSNEDIPATDIREGAIIEASLDPKRKQDLKASQNDYELAVSDHSLNPVRAGLNISSRNDTANVESLSQNSLDQLSQGQSQEHGETEGKKMSNNMGSKQRERKPVRRQPKRQKKG